MIENPTKMKEEVNITLARELVHFFCLQKDVSSRATSKINLNPILSREKMSFDENALKVMNLFL